MVGNKYLILNTLPPLKITTLLLKLCVLNNSYLNFYTSFSGSIQPSNDTKLKFYSYYKQATEGPCDAPKPSFWEVVNKAKW